MRNKKLNKSIKITLLSVIAFLIMYIELPIPFFPEFLKIDVSDIPALIGAFAFGPLEGIIIELIKNILHGVFATKTAFIGEVANFLVGAVIVGTSGIIYRGNKTKKSAILALAIGSIAMSIAAAMVNYYVLLPLYEKVLNVPIQASVELASKVNPMVTDLWTFILWTIVPFNLIKGVFVSIITLGMYKSVSPMLHKENAENELAKN
ncbi:ECF transporter S component [Clostridium sp. MSJ-11]|uniref:Riboflavin transporter n=1 Tax=Clostridium mobile TaxID=2841512 RepID=A0ABS6ELI3_9CLOT|nr:ECF transporter S component [Clostridium mobile]MBU5486091.1 ECF transporter S component [Clostridium mobile]